MVRLYPSELPKWASDSLQAWQADVDFYPEYVERVAAAKVAFKQKNTKSNRVFRQVKLHLSDMCSGAKRCHYCEDSSADEVEHVKPRSLYPEDTFNWSNYVYACGICNLCKISKHGVIVNESLLDVTRKKDDAVLPPPSGESAFLNPRSEDPENFMILDVRQTFRFVLDPSLDNIAKLRASFTLQTLKLNDREELVFARKEAYKNYVARLKDYVQRRQLGETQDTLKHVLNSISRMNHPSVWRAMKRYHDRIPEIKALFEAAPEALDC